jgi:gluconolactonase
MGVVTKPWITNAAVLTVMLFVAIASWPASRNALAQRGDPIVPAGKDVEQAVRLVMTETPSVDHDGNVYFEFGFFIRGIPRKLMKITPEGVTSIFRDNYVGGATMWDSENRLIILGSQVNGHPGITREDLKTGKVEVLAEGYQGTPFQAPNDFTMDLKERIYFTDRPGRAVYRVDGPGTVARILTEADLQEPNGIQVSPDQKHLYVVESSQAKGANRRINAYDLAPDGTVSHMRVLYDFRPGRSADGMKSDVEGNIYAVAGINFPSTLHIRPNRAASDETLDTKAGVYVISPQGKLLKFIPVPEDTLTNLTFGGPDMKTLFICAGKTIFKVRTDITGCPAGPCRAPR